MPPPIEVLGTFKSGRTGLKDAQHSVRPSTSLQGEEKLGPLLSPAKEKKKRRKISAYDYRHWSGSAYSLFHVNLGFGKVCRKVVSEQLK